MSENNNIRGSSATEVWAHLFLKLMERGRESLRATMVTIEKPSFEMVEQRNPVVDAIDKLLRIEAKPVVRESAGIIFPYSQWRTKGWHIEELTHWYLTIFMPRLSAVSPRHGKTYFERMVNYTGWKQTQTEQKMRTVNQLHEVIQLCKKEASRDRHFRQSGLQLGLFDPAKDLTASALSNFPCLQQIGLSFDPTGALLLNAYYPTQFIVERGLGNYIGLCQLGLFIASELDIPFGAFTCFIGSPQLGKMNKTQLRHLEQTAREYLENLPAPV